LMAFLSLRVFVWYGFGVILASLMFVFSPWLQ
jgi:hypothetical protein